MIMPLAVVDGGLLGVIGLIIIAVGSRLGKKGNGRIPSDEEIEAHPERFPGAVKMLPWDQGDDGRSMSFEYDPPDEEERFAMRAAEEERIRAAEKKYQDWKGKKML